MRTVFILILFLCGELHASPAFFLKPGELPAKTQALTVATATAAGTSSPSTLKKVGSEVAKVYAGSKAKEIVTAVWKSRLGLWVSQRAIPVATRAALPVAVALATLSQKGDASAEVQHLQIEYDNKLKTYSDRLWIYLMADDVFVSRVKGKIREGVEYLNQKCLAAHGSQCPTILPEKVFLSQLPLVMGYRQASTYQIPAYILLLPNSKEAIALVLAEMQFFKIPNSLRVALAKKYQGSAWSSPSVSSMATRFARELIGFDFTEDQVTQAFAQYVEREWKPRNNRESQEIFLEEFWDYTFAVRFIEIPFVLEDSLIVATAPCNKSIDNLFDVELPACFKQKVSELKHSIEEGGVKLQIQKDNREAWKIFGFGIAGMVTVEGITKYAMTYVKSPRKLVRGSVWMTMMVVGAGVVLPMLLPEEGRATIVKHDPKTGVVSETNPKFELLEKMSALENNGIVDPQKFDEEMRKYLNDYNLKMSQAVQ
ncbi:MAG: hypothetical protein AB7F59_06310 [Bdellovibrionales bacterium]